MISYLHLPDHELARSVVIFVDFYVIFLLLLLFYQFVLVLKERGRNRENVRNLGKTAIKLRLR